MKIRTKITIATFAALLPMAAIALANDPVGETAEYRLVRIQVGNSQPAIAYVRKENTTVAVDANGMSVGGSTNRNLSVEPRQNFCGGQRLQSIPGGIN